MNFNEITAKSSLLLAKRLTGTIKTCLLGANYLTRHVRLVSTSDQRARLAIHVILIIVYLPLKTRNNKIVKKSSYRENLTCDLILKRHKCHVDRTSCLYIIHTTSYYNILFCIYSAVRYYVHR